jgi:hypothetical protein
MTLYRLLTRSPSSWPRSCHFATRGVHDDSIRSKLQVGELVEVASGSDAAAHAWLAYIVATGDDGPMVRPRCMHAPDVCAATSHSRAGCSDM